MVKSFNEKSPNKVNLGDLFCGLQKQLTAELQIAREHIPHNGDMGTVSENKWREMLTRHLPARYRVEKGIVVDSNGDCSHSIDIVIFDRQYTNLLMAHGEQLFIPAESVYAVLEVKQEISKGTIVYAGEKAASVRKLKRTSAPVFHVEGIAKPKPPIPILAGLISLDSTWNPLFGEPFRAAMKIVASDVTTILDIGCCVTQGAFELNGQVIENSKPENSLIFFLLRLMKRLQQLGTVSAIDFNAYEQWI